MVRALYNASIWVDASRVRGRALVIGDGYIEQIILCEVKSASRTNCC